MLAIVCISTAALIDRDGDGLGSALFWSAVYNARTFYALLSFPFLVLAVPVLGPALVGAKPTGYDEAGRLVPRLTPTEARLKFDADQKRREERWAARLAKIGIHGARHHQPRTLTSSSCRLHPPQMLSTCSWVRALNPGQVLARRSIRPRALHSIRFPSYHVGADREGNAREK